MIHHQVLSLSVVPFWAIIYGICKEAGLCVLLLWRLWHCKLLFPYYFLIQYRLWWVIPLFWLMLFRSCIQSHILSKVMSWYYWNKHWLLNLEGGGKCESYIFRQFKFNFLQLILPTYLILFLTKGCHATLFANYVSVNITYCSDWLLIWLTI